ncbi:MAG: HAD family hydrolase [Anaerolineae bacterium]
MSEWQGLEALIFDLDGTLYDNRDLLAAYPRLAVDLIAARRGLARREATLLYEQTWSELAAEEYSGMTSTTRVLMRLTGITLDEWAQYLQAHLDPAAYLEPGAPRWMGELFRWLHRRYRLGLVSNNNRFLADRILSLLGIAGSFDALLTTTESGRLKPDYTLYLEIADRLQVPVHACLSIGDREAADIAPARMAGMRAVLVHGPEDVRRLALALLGESARAGLAFQGAGGR